MDTLPVDDRYIKLFMKYVLLVVDSYEDTLDDLQIDWKENSFSFKLSNGKRILYKPIIID